MSDRHAHYTMVDELAKMIWSKETWLHDFSGGRNKRTDHEIELKKRELSVLHQAWADYKRAAERTVA